jgi:hypothetical protein
MTLAARAFRCVCGRPVFFRNSICLACKTRLGFEPKLGEMVAVSPGTEPGTWEVLSDMPGAAKLYRRCNNLESPASCNWLIPVAEPADETPALCLSCRLNRTIPDLSAPDNARKWGRIETAKRRLIASLLKLNLPIASRADDPVAGLGFDFLKSPPEGPTVMTGHADGIITLNIDEADDSTREQIRQQLREPYRTLLGHLRHEIGHFYWDRLIRGTDWIAAFRKFFGDERSDYEAALRVHYAQGPPPDWQAHYVSAYATSHPWEDWAETWAHYLHMTDTLDTARRFGIDNVQIEFEPFTPESLFGLEHHDGKDFLEFLNFWAELTAVLNELSRSMGLPDFYPFVLSRDAVAKLHFVHTVIASGQTF